MTLLKFYKYNIVIVKKLKSIFAAIGLILCINITLMGWGIYQMCISVPEQNFAGQTDAFFAHAFGRIDDKNYTNSLEAFEYSYNEKGFRYFEVDFGLTSDKKVVLMHNGKTGNGYQKAENMTHNEFMNLKIYDKYTPMDIESFAKLVDDYPDAYFITDTKYTNKNKIAVQFEQIIEKVAQYNEDNLKRIIPQVYNSRMFDQIMQMHHFNEVIFTLYKTTAHYTQIISACKTRPEIKMITMQYTMAMLPAINAFNKAGLKVYTHTINSAKSMNRYRAMGVYGFYTDKTNLAV